MAKRKRPAAAQERPSLEGPEFETEVRAVSVTVPDQTSQEDERNQRVYQLRTEFIGLALRRFETASNATRALRERQKNDWDYSASDQWDPHAKASRRRDRKPVQTVNRLPQFIRQVTNAQRQSNLAVKVSPFDDGGDIQTAEIIQGLIRNIEQQSDAPVAYSTAGDHQARIGVGYWQIVPEWEDEAAWQQVLRIKRILDPFSVYFDPAAIEHDRTDARYCFVIEDMPKDEFKRRFGDDRMASFETWRSSDQHYRNDWAPEGRVRVANYWYVDHEPDSLLLIQWPPTHPDVPPREESIFESEFKANTFIQAELKADRGPLILKTRKVERRVVRQALINGAEILEGNVADDDHRDDEWLDHTEGWRWPGKWIPVVPVIGDELMLAGEIDLRGMVRDAKSSQESYNYMLSTMLELVGQMPKTPWTGPEGTFKGHERKWRFANRLTFDYLEYKLVQAPNGQLGPAPTRTVSGVDLAPLVVLLQQADNDMKATMGLYEPSLGIRDTAGQSGKAINLLQKQGEMANSNFLDNLARAIRYTGRLIIDLIPHFYDAPRVIRIMGTDERLKTAMVYTGEKWPKVAQLERDAAGKRQPPEGVDAIANLANAARYDIVVNAGPSIESKRQEAFVALSQFVQAYPAAFAILGDLLVQSLDWPGAQAAADRLKKALPPHLRDEKDMAGGMDLPTAIAKIQELMAQLQQAGVQIEELQGAVKGHEIRAKADIARTQLQTASDERLAELEAKMKLLIEQFKASADRAEQKAEHAHEMGMAMAQHALQPPPQPGTGGESVADST